MTMAMIFRFHSQNWKKDERKKIKNHENEDLQNEMTEGYMHREDSHVMMPKKKNMMALLFYLENIPKHSEKGREIRKTDRAICGDEWMDL